jgi:hypothetical protein
MAVHAGHRVRWPSVPAGLRPLAAQQPVEDAFSKEQKMRKEAMQKRDIERPERILARQLARELSRDQLPRISGGWSTSSAMSSSTPEGEGDDGGADD